MAYPDGHEVMLDPYRDGDRELLQRLLGDPAMMRFLGGPEPVAALDRRHARYLSADPVTHGIFTIVLAPDSERVGWVGFWEHSWQAQLAWECGWHVLPEFQGRGIASQATVLMLDEARKRARHRYVDAFPNVENETSNRVCARVGFERLGEVDVEFPKGHSMHSAHWRYDLSGGEPG
jgi:RimJ/RimL family protein N-acetyltransferase